MPIREGFFVLLRLVGDFVGAEDGLAVGDRIGALVGTAVGLAVGDRV